MLLIARHMLSGHPFPALHPISSMPRPKSQPPWGTHLCFVAGRPLRPLHQQCRLSTSPVQSLRRQTGVCWCADTPAPRPLAKRTSYPKVCSLPAPRDPCEDTLQSPTAGTYSVMSLVLAPSLPISLPTLLLFPGLSATGLRSTCSYPSPDEDHP